MKYIITRAKMFAHRTFDERSIVHKKESTRKNIASRTESMLLDSLALFIRKSLVQKDGA